MTGYVLDSLVCLQWIPACKLKIKFGEEIAIITWKETLQLLHNIHDYTFSHFSEPFSTCLVVYKLKNEFVWNNISCWIYDNNVKYHSKEVAQWCSVKKNVLTISQNSLKNTYARVSFLLKLQAEACNFIKKKLSRRCFPVNFAMFIRAHFL